MQFARQIVMPQAVPDLGRFVDTPRQKKDPCFKCSLPICDDRDVECKFIQIGHSSRTIERERQEAIELQREEDEAQGLLFVTPGTRRKIAADEKLKADILAILRKLKKDIDEERR